MANPKDRETIQSLRLSIREAIDALKSVDPMSNPGGFSTAVSILQAAYDNTDPKLLDKDCGCG